MIKQYRNGRLAGVRSAIRSGEEGEEEEEEKEEKQGEGADPLAHKFLKTRQIILAGEINKSSAERVIRQLLVLEADSDSEPIKIFTRARHNGAGSCRGTGVGTGSGPCART